MIIIGKFFLYLFALWLTTVLFILFISYLKSLKKNQLKIEYKYEIAEISKMLGLKSITIPDYYDPKESSTLDKLLVDLLKSNDIFFSSTDSKYYFNDKALNTLKMYRAYDKINNLNVECIKAKIL